MKKTILILMFIGIVVISNAVRMKIKTEQAMMYSQNITTIDYAQVALTYLSTTNDLIPSRPSSGSNLD